MTEGEDRATKIGGGKRTKQRRLLELWGEKGEKIKARIVTVKKNGFETGVRED